jgi:hypothetical protein
VGDPRTWKDNDARFHVIPMSFAKRYASAKKTVPLLLVHNKRLKVGTVKAFAVERRKINNESRDVLMADFDITNEGFIRAVQDSASLRFKDLKPTSYASSDGFLSPHTLDGAETTDFDLTARVALLQRFPGLSLGHNVDTLGVKEMSLCLAGARPTAVVTHARYLADDAGDDGSSGEVASFTSVLASMLATSNGPLNQKASADILSLANMPTSVLDYSKPALIKSTRVAVAAEKGDNIDGAGDANETSIRHRRSSGDATAETTASPTSAPPAMDQVDQLGFPPNFSSSARPALPDTSPPQLSSAAGGGAGRRSKDYYVGFYEAHHASGVNHQPVKRPFPSTGEDEMHEEPRPRGVGKRQRHGDRAMDYRHADSYGRVGGAHDNETYADIYGEMRTLREDLRSLNETRAQEQQRAKEAERAADEERARLEKAKQDKEQMQAMCSQIFEQTRSMIAADLSSKSAASSAVVAAERSASGAHEATQEDMPAAAQQPVHDAALQLSASQKKDAKGLTKTANYSMTAKGMQEPAKNAMQTLRSIACRDAYLFDAEA